jgi:hypothetical protein
MADQDDDGAGSKIIPALGPGGDNTNFPAKIARAAAALAPGALPIGGAVRAVGRMFGGPKRDDIAD